MRIVHEEKYVYAFGTFEEALQSSRDIRKYYDEATYIEAVVSFIDKLPLTEEEIALAAITPSSKVIGTWLPDTKVLPKRRMRIRKEGQ